MLSRTAERIYWLGRYTERAENTARLVRVNTHLILDLPRSVKVGWGSLISIAGSDQQFGGDLEKADERAVIRFLLADREHPASILSSLMMARENARTTREIFPSEAWELINDLYHFAKEGASKGVARKGRHHFVSEIISGIQQLTGLLSGTMSHTNAYDFVRLGRNLERADMTTRIVDVGSHNLLTEITKSGKQETVTALEPYENILWMSVLGSLGGYQMYRQNVLDRVNAEDVVTFLLQDERFPRSVAHCLRQVESCLKMLPHSDEVVRVVVTILRNLNESNIADLLEGDLHDFIDELQAQIATIHDTIAESWFLPTS